ncbi:hypothetical protein HA466_0192860 [Hirschfeldia incana]|nr:hypothetical protein HA466_0192860 [Hirschfeldia incana]
MAFRRSLLLLQVLLVVTFLTCSAYLPETTRLAGDNDVVEVNRSQREFDYFALSLQWPGTYCRGTRHCCSKNACCRGSDTPTQFTIHGLWPDYNDGSWPSCCYRSDFNEKEISTLLDGMEKYWPSLSCGSPSSCHGGKGSFWGHERNMGLARLLLFVMSIVTSLPRLISTLSITSRMSFIKLAMLLPTARSIL